MRRTVKAIVPAAGKGTRLHTDGSTAPKALRTLCGKAMVDYVLDNLAFVEKENTYIVVGYKGGEVRAHIGAPYHFVEQPEQLGTGHAVRVCEEYFRDFDGTVVVTFGDMPLFRYDVMKAMCERLEETNAACVLLTAENPELTMWARVIRENGRFKAIVEGKDCTPEQAKTKELFAGVLVFDSKTLFRLLPKMSNQNVQHEYYLTEMPEIMSREGLLVETYMTDDANDLRGVNAPEDIPLCEAILRERFQKGTAIPPVTER